MNLPEATVSEGGVRIIAQPILVYILVKHNSLCLFKLKI